MGETTQVLSREVLARGFAVLEKIVFRRRRSDCEMSEFTREILDTGDGATILPYDPARKTIILIRQFRGVAFLKQGKEGLIEACAGKLEGADPLSRIVKETEEETGIRLTARAASAVRGLFLARQLRRAADLFRRALFGRGPHLEGRRPRRGARGHRGDRDDAGRRDRPGRARRDRRYQNDRPALLGAGDRPDVIGFIARRDATDGGSRQDNRSLSNVVPNLQVKQPQRGRLPWSASFWSQPIQETSKRKLGFWCVLLRR